MYQLAQMTRAQELQQPTSSKWYSLGLAPERWVRHSDRGKDGELQHNNNVGKLTIKSQKKQ